MLYRLSLIAGFRSTWLCAAFMLWSGVAVGQVQLGADRLNLNRMVFTPDMNGIGPISSAYVDGGGISHLSSTFQYTDRLLVQGAEPNQTYPIDSQLRLDLSHALNILNIFQLQVSAPIVVTQQYDNSGLSEQNQIAKQSVNGLSEPTIGLKYRFVGEFPSDLNIAFLLRAALPFASHTDAFLNESSLRVEPRILFSSQRPWIRAVGALGGVFRGEAIEIETLETTYVLADQLAFDVGIGIRLHEVKVPVEVFAFSVNRFGLTGQGRDLETDTIISSHELGVGARWDISKNWGAVVGSAWSEKAALGTPASRLYGQVYFRFGDIEAHPDFDADAYKQERKARRDSRKGDKSGSRSTRGSSETTKDPTDTTDPEVNTTEPVVEYEIPDTDQDRIPDDEDLCPYEFGLPLTQGCPDYDSDGVADEEDQCPQTKGLAIYNGCPSKKK